MPMKNATTGGMMRKRKWKKWPADVVYDRAPSRVKLSYKSKDDSFKVLRGDVFREITALCANRFTIRNLLCTLNNRSSPTEEGKTLF